MSMLRISVTNSLTRTTAIVSSEKTMREVFEENNVEIGNSMVTFDGSVIKPGDLDRPLDEYNLDDAVTHSLSAVAKTENAAKAHVIGGAIILSSDATPDQIKTLTKYRPNALKLVNKESKDVEYVVAMSESGLGSINNNGAVFSAHTNNDGKATITIGIPDNVDDGKAWFVDTLGKAMLNLQKVEAQFDAELESVLADREAVESAVTVG